MPSCVVKACKNYMSKLKKSQGITYHRFPKEKNRRDEWVLIIRNCRGENTWNPSPASTVCSTHFDDIDFMTSAKGRRCLVPHAIPKRLLSNSPETQTESTFSPILQVSPNARGMANDQQPTSSSTTISSLPQVPVIKDEFKLTGYCRLCATSVCDGTLVNVESDNVMKELIVKMSDRLNTNIDFSQKHLPTTVCSACVKSLYTAYDFVVGIDLAQTTLNKISMQKHKCQMIIKIEDTDVDLSNTSLQQESGVSCDLDPLGLHVSSETISSQQANNGSVACDLDPLGLHVSSETTSSQQLSPKIEAAPQPHSVQLRRLNYTLHKKSRTIDLQKKKIKTLNQKIRRFRNRNESLKNILKNLKNVKERKETIFICMEDGPTNNDDDE